MSGTTLPDPPAVLWWLPALRQPQQALGWNLPQWEHVVRVARRLRLLGRLAESIEAAGLRERLPLPVGRHLLAEMRASRWQTGVMVWGLHRVADELGDTPYPRVLLKGAAYVGQGLPIARGRLPSDLDILVPHADVSDAQSRLLRAGWQEPELDAHDQRFYHAWSHEVPPMQHPSLPLELDLHHNILPPRNGRLLPVGQLLTEARPSRFAGWVVFQPIDQVLHSAAHLFNDSDLRDRVRDLVDLDGLVRHFGTEPGFWEALIARARALELDEPLGLALPLCAQWLRTPVPVEVQQAVQPSGLRRVHRSALLWLFAQALLPVEPDAPATLAQRVAAQVLFVRFHLRRLPLKRLLPHVWHKLQGVWRPRVAPSTGPGSELQFKSTAPTQPVATATPPR